MKKSVFKKFTAAVLCLTMLASLGVFMSSGMFARRVTASDLDDARQEREEKLEQQKEVQELLDEYRQQASDTQEYMQLLDEQMSELDGNLYELGIQIEDLSAQIAETEENLEAAQQDAANQYEMMKLRIKFMYEHNDESYLALILASDSMGEMLNRAEYVSKISSYDRDMLTKYEETVEYIASTKQQLDNDYASMTQMQASLESQRNDLAAIQQEKEAELEKYNHLIADTELVDTELSNDISGLDALIAQIEAESNQNSSSNPPANSTGVFLWPTISRRITSDYGDMDGRTSPHTGIDIGATTPGVWGDPIYAADGGRVIRAEYNWSAGNWIWIDHGNGLYTIYMHCSTFLVSVGDTVNRGDTIALMGSTGQSTGAHLHFSVRYGGAYVNPWGYLQ